MKVALDENIPLGIVRAFQALTKEGTISGVEFVSARDYSEDHEKDDVPWVKRFAADGGGVIISGDKRMRGRLHERDALASVGMIVFYFTSAWSNANEFTKSAMLLLWWPKIAEYMESSKAGACWEIPFQWHWKELRDVRADKDGS